MASTHGTSCICEGCLTIRAALGDPQQVERARRMVIKAMFWKIVAPQINEHMQHALSEAFRITTNVKGMERVIDAQLTKLWKEVDREQ